MSDPTPGTSRFTALPGFKRQLPLSGLAFTIPATALFAQKDAWPALLEAMCAAIETFHAHTGREVLAFASRMDKMNPLHKPEPHVCIWLAFDPGGLATEDYEALSHGVLSTHKAWTVEGMQGLKQGNPFPILASEEGVAYVVLTEEDGTPVAIFLGLDDNGVLDTFGAKDWSALAALPSTRSPAVVRWHTGISVAQMQAALAHHFLWQLVAIKGLNEPMRTLLNTHLPAKTLAELGFLAKDGFSPLLDEAIKAALVDPVNAISQPARDAVLRIVIEASQIGGKQEPEAIEVVLTAISLLGFEELLPQA